MAPCEEISPEAATLQEGEVSHTLQAFSSYLFILCTKGRNSQAVRVSQVKSIDAIQAIAGLICLLTIDRWRFYKLAQIVFAGDSIPLHAVQAHSVGVIEIIAEWADENTHSCPQVVPLPASDAIHLEIVL